MAAEKTNDDKALIESLSVLAKMNPLDGADVHFRLGSALHRSNQLALAKRQIIMALEKAPRYRDAHRLLLKIHQQQAELDPANKAAVPTSPSPGDADPLGGASSADAKLEHGSTQTAEPKVKKDLP